MIRKGWRRKKVLSLVLCVAVMLSVMVVGAGAAFSDQSKIQNTEAVDMCVALNIINGYEDGTYRPANNITRAEVTKMICIALNGGKEPNLGTTSNPTFNDVRTDKNSAWAEAYIESCVSQGIVAGVAPGKFAPSNNVTGSELAKMLLVALGYKSENEGFYGSAWEINTNTIASAKGLYEGLESIDVSAALTRDSAAQMIWNALNAYEVEYKTILTTDGNGQLTSQVVVQDKVVGSTNDKITLLEDKYEAETFTGTFDGNADVLGLDNGLIQVTGDNNASTPKPVQATFLSDLDIQYIGEEVKVLYKDATDGIKDQPDKKDTIYGVYVTGATKVINTTLDGIDDAADGKKIEIDGVKYECAALEKDAVYLVKNLGQDESTLSADTSATEVAKLFASLNKQSGSPVKFVCDTNGKIVKAYVTESTINKVSAVTSSKVTLNTIGGLDKEDNNIYSGAAKDDVVIATKLFSDGTYTVTPAETVTGTLDGYLKEGNAYTKVTIDGTVYKINEKTLENVSDDCVTKISDSDLESEVTAYMINGMVGALEVAEGASDWAVIADYNNEKGLQTSFDAAKVELITANGDSIIAEIHKDSTYENGKDITSQNISTYIKEGALVKYVQTSDSVVKIKEVATTTTEVSGGDKIYNDDTKTLTTDATNNKSTVVSSDAPAYITNSDGDIKVYTLRDLKTITAPTDENDSSAATTVNYVIDSGKVIAAYIDLGSRPTGSASSTVYGEVTATLGTVSYDGDYYNKYTVVSNGETYTLYTNKDLAKKALVSFDPTSDDIYNTNDITVYNGEQKATDAKAVWVDEYDGDTLTYYTSATKNNTTQAWEGENITTDAVDEDVVIVYVDLDDASNAGEEAGLDEFSAGTGYANAVVVYDTDGKTIIAIFVETSGEVDLSTVVKLPTATEGADTNDKNSESGESTTPNTGSEGNETEDTSGN